MWPRRSGETVTETVRPAARPLAGYRDPKPMVFCGLYPVDGDQFSDLRGPGEAAPQRRQLHLRAGSRGRWGSGSAAASWGSLHMEIVRERLGASST